MEAARASHPRKWQRVLTALHAGRSFNHWLAPTSFAKARELLGLTAAPPPENDNARRVSGAGETGLDNKADYTPSNAEAVKTDLLAVLSRRAWIFSYTLEEARQHYAASGKVLREVCVCVALALLLLGGARDA